MKIYSFIRTYSPSEQGDTLMQGHTPTWYVMPESSVLRSGNPFFVPDFDTEFKAYPSLCLRIGRLGKGIAPRFVSRYIDGWTMSVAVVAADRLRTLREEGEPWTDAVSFDRSCWIGNLQPIDSLINYDAFTIECSHTSAVYTAGNIFPAKEELISLLSRNNTLKNGDLVLIGLLPDGITLTPGTRMHIQSANKDIELIDINIK